MSALAPFTPPGDVVQPVADVIVGRAETGKAETYRPTPHAPSMQQLEYVQRFATAGLLALGFLFLAGYALISPLAAARLIARGARRQAGMG